MNAPVRHRSPIRVNLTLPVTRLGFGPFSFDPLEQLIGAKVADVLEPLMFGPIERRPSASGAAVEVYPLALPDGEGASIALGHLGELGFANDQGRLLLTVPKSAAAWLQARLGSAEAREHVVDGAVVVTLAVSLRPGMRAAWPIGTFGEVGIEAA